MPGGFGLAIALCSLLTASVSVPLLIKVGHRYHLLDHPGRHKRHKKAVPYLGGPALFASVWLAVLLSIWWYPDWFLGASSLFYVFLGSLVILLVGLADDIAPQSAWLKLTAQVLVGLMLYLSGLRVELLSTPYGSVEVGAASLVITVLWVVVLTNAINLIDGLDGLAGGVSLIAAVTLLGIGYHMEVGWVTVFMLGMIGFLIPFLVFNSYPARIFLGDSGSMQLGYYFAVFSLLVPLKSFTLSALYLPLLVLGVPILETISSFVRRLSSGRNVMQADRRHLFHFLALAGLSHRRVLLVFYVLGLVFAAFTLAMLLWNRLVVLMVLVVFMVVILTAFFILVTGLATRRRRGRRTANKTIKPGEK